VGASSIQESRGAKGPKETDFGIVSDFFQFAMMADWLETTPIADRKFERMLDVGGGTGLIGQLFKASGRTRCIENIEILDYSESLDMNLVRYYANKVQNGRRELYSLGDAVPQVSNESLLKRLRKAIGPLPSPCSASSREDQVWVLGQLDHMTSTFPYPTDSNSHYWKIDPKHDLKLDRYITGDFFELQDQYDFLFVSTTMAHFSVPDFLEKAYSLLRPGGIIFAWNAYWYWVLLVTCLYADFPWGAQRLTWDDYLRYLRDHRPDELASAPRSAEVMHPERRRYTVSDYVQEAEKVGFKYIDHHRLRPFSAIPKNVGGFSLLGDHGVSVQRDVLRDIHCFKQNVRLKDLTTQSVFLVFERP
jgi:SAM-dependent methyltransferase